jgi:hypothetical protein
MLNLALGLRGLRVKLQAGGSHGQHEHEGGNRLDCGRFHGFLPRQVHRLFA